MNATILSRTNQKSFYIPLRANKESSGELCITEPLSAVHRLSARATPGWSVIPLSVVPRRFKSSNIPYWVYSAHLNSDELHRRRNLFPCWHWHFLEPVNKPSRVFTCLFTYTARTSIVIHKFELVHEEACYHKLPSSSKELFNSRRAHIMRSIQIHITWEERNRCLIEAHNVSKVQPRMFLPSAHIPFIRTG